MKTKSTKRGQTMVEYILIVALIAIALIGVVAAFSKGTGRLFSGVTSKINEDAGDEARNIADDISGDTIRELSED
ncbi:MAG: Flp family type IVb pilin [Kiritimatiellae bacterium]|nr:Flp family type IVb pilin [Kiritimatiellia bacterium]